MYRLSNDHEVNLDEKAPRPELDLNVDATVRSEFFPPKGPIRATEFGLHH